MILKNITLIEPVKTTGTIRVPNTVLFVPKLEHNKITTIIKNKQYNVIFKNFKVKYLFSNIHNDVYPLNTIKTIYKEKYPKDISLYWNIVSPDVKLKGVIKNNDIIVDIEYMNKTYEKLYIKSNK